MLRALCPHQPSQVGHCSRRRGPEQVLCTLRCRSHVQGCKVLLILCQVLLSTYQHQWEEFHD